VAIYLYNLISKAVATFAKNVAKILATGLQFFFLHER